MFKKISYADSVKAENFTLLKKSKIDNILTIFIFVCWATSNHCNSSGTYEFYLK